MISKRADADQHSHLNGMSGAETSQEERRPGAGEGAAEAAAVGEEPSGRARDGHRESV